MTYYIKYKPTGRRLEGFDNYWRAEETIAECYDLPEGYTFKRDVYEIVDEDGNHVDKPEEEKLLYCISVVHGELPESFFKYSEINQADEFHLYSREVYFETFREAEEALENYRCSKINHKAACDGEDIITFRQYFIEDNQTREVLKIAKYGATDSDWRGGKYNEYDCYADERH